MNTKNIVLIASVIAVLGLLAAVIFGLMDLVTFGLVTTSVLGVLYGLIKKFDNVELKTKLVRLKSDFDSGYKLYEDVKDKNEILKDEIANKNAHIFSLEQTVDLNKKAFNNLSNEFAELQAKPKEQPIVIKPVITKRNKNKLDK